MAGYAADRQWLAQEQATHCCGPIKWAARNQHIRTDVFRTTTTEDIPEPRRSGNDSNLAESLLCKTTSRSPRAVVRPTHAASLTTPVMRPSQIWKGLAIRRVARPTDAASLKTPVSPKTLSLEEQSRHRGRRWLRLAAFGVRR